MNVKFDEIVKYPERISQITNNLKINIGYEDLKNHIAFFTTYFGNNAKCIFTEKNAFMIFEQHPNILISIIKKDGYQVEDLYFKDIKIQVVGTSKKNIKGFFRMLIEDIQNNIFKIVVFIIAYIFIFNSIESLQQLNENLINIISIFIGTLFVFIAFFYEDKEKIKSMVDEGHFDSHFEIDKYIFKLGMLALTLIVVSNGVINLKCKGILTNIKDIISLHCKWVYILIKDYLPIVLTGIGLIFIIICFLSIIDYYLKKIKSNLITESIRNFRREFENKKS